MFPPGTPRGPGCYGHSPCGVPTPHCQAWHALSRSVKYPSTHFRLGQPYVRHICALMQLKALLSSYKKKQMFLITPSSSVGTFPSQASILYVKINYIRVHACCTCSSHDSSIFLRTLGMRTFRLVLTTLFRLVLRYSVYAIL